MKTESDIITETSLHFSEGSSSSADIPYLAQLPTRLDPISVTEQSQLN